VVATALESVSTPFNKEARASTPNLRSYADYLAVGQEVIWRLQNDILYGEDWRYSVRKILHTLCANLCCCMFIPVAAPVFDLERELTCEDADGRIEARVLEVSARCIVRRNTQE